MAHNHSWIDPEALQSLVKDTAYRSVGGDDAPPTAHAGSPWVEPNVNAPVGVPTRPPERERTYEPERALAQAPPSPRPTRATGSVRRATRPTLPNVDLQLPGAPPPVRASMLEPFTPVAGSVESRLEHLMVWACKVTGLSRAYVAAADGLLVASLNAGASAVDDAAAAVELCSRSVPADVGGADAGSVTMVAAERTHVIAWDLTRHGRTYLSLSGTVEPTSEALATLSRALRDALR